MSGHVAPSRHDDLRRRLRALIAQELPAQVGRRAGAALAAFSVAAILVGLVGAGGAGIVVADDNWCGQVPGDCARAKAIAGGGGAILLAGAAGLALGLAVGAAARRAERAAWAAFEADWDAALGARPDVSAARARRLQHEDGVAGRLRRRGWVAVAD